VPAGGRVPYFEVLLRTDLLLGTTSAYEVAAVRRIERGAPAGS
jgi:hypothetical protein